MKPYLDEPPEVQATLSTAVQFFLMTSTIPRIGNRIECWLVRDRFDATVQQVCLGVCRDRHRETMLSDSLQSSWRPVFEVSVFMGPCLWLQRLGNSATGTNRK